jgi:radical SAM protein with 4Fe4S-binding SPASM domain
VINPALRFLPHVFWKSRPVHLTLFLTKRCNAGCPFCFYRTAENEATDELSLEELERLSGEFGPLLWLAFSGGEIFLRRDLPEIARIFYRNNRPSIMLFPTNGRTPDRISQYMEQILRDCPESIVAAKVSIDGIGEMHDKLRGTPGSFDKAIETIDALKGLAREYRNLELGVNTVFMRQNQDHMDGIIDYVSGLEGVRTHTISLVRGDAPEEFKGIDTNRYLKAVTRLENETKQGRQPVYGFSGARLKAAQDILQRRIIHRTITENRQQVPCYAGKLNLVVTETGDIYPCERFEPAFRLGNLREEWEKGNRLKETLSSGVARQIIKGIRESCKCTHECYVMTNILFNPCQYPALIREYLSIRKNP